MWECKNLLNLWEEVKRWKQLGMKHHKCYYNVDTLVWGKNNNIMVFQEILVRKDVFKLSRANRRFDEIQINVHVVLFSWLDFFQTEICCLLIFKPYFWCKFPQFFSAIWGWKWFVQMSALSSCVIHYFKTFWTESYWSVCTLLTNLLIYYRTVLYLFECPIMDYNCKLKKTWCRLRKVKNLSDVCQKLLLQKVLLSSTSSMTLTIMFNTVRLY